jgi:hypothetical protein
MTGSKFLAPEEVSERYRGGISVGIHFETGGQRSDALGRYVDVNTRAMYR